ncbi:MAG: Hsp20/alpha crystallin family protein [Acidimicrobiales bacterium]
MLLQNDPFFANVFNRLASGASDTQTSQYLAPMDAYRRGSDVWVHIDLPGVAADTLDISVERSVLTVVGERFWDRQEGDQVYVNDRPQGRFRRQVHLGEGLDPEHIEADYHDGVLTLRIPVAEKAKPRKISVKASSPVIETGLAEGSEGSEGQTEESADA